MAERKKYKFYTNYNPGPKTMDYNSGEVIVDSSGYIPPKQRIENLIRAGERLEEFRREFYDYDYGDEDDGNWIDPLRSPGIDLADVSRIQNQALFNLRSRSKKNLEDSVIEKEIGTQASASAAASSSEGGTDAKKV